MLAEIFRKLKYWRKTDRIGPDIPLTHWRLYFRSTMLKLCKKKFHHFADTAELRPGCYVVGCSQISIGNRVVIRPNTQLHGETATAAVSIVIEDDVLIGSGVNIYVENHRFSNPDIPIIDQGHESSRPVRICKGAWLGANVVVLPGVTIGEGAVIGAGAVVTKDIPPHGVAVGAAARVVKQLR